MREDSSQPSTCHRRMSAREQMQVFGNYKCSKAFDYNAEKKLSTKEAVVRRVLLKNYTWATEMYVIYLA